MSTLIYSLRHYQTVKDLLFKYHSPSPFATSWNCIRICHSKSSFFILSSFCFLFMCCVIYVSSQVVINFQEHLDSDESPSIYKVLLFKELHKEKRLTGQATLYGHQFVRQGHLGMLLRSGLLNYQCDQDSMNATKIPKMYAMSEKSRKLF